MCTTVMMMIVLIIICLGITCSSTRAKSSSTNSPRRRIGIFEYLSRDSERILISKINADNEKAKLKIVSESDRTRATAVAKINADNEIEKLKMVSESETDDESVAKN